MNLTDKKQNKNRFLLSWSVNTSTWIKDDVIMFFRVIQSFQRKKKSDVMFSTIMFSSLFYLS